MYSSCLKLTPRRYLIETRPHFFVVKHEVIDEILMRAKLHQSEQHYDKLSAIACHLEQYYGNQQYCLFDIGFLQELLSIHDNAEVCKSSLQDSAAKIGFFHSVHIRSSATKELVVDDLLQQLTDYVRWKTEKNVDEQRTKATIVISSSLERSSCFAIMTELIDYVSNSSGAKEKYDLRLVTKSRKRAQGALIETLNLLSRHKSKRCLSLLRFCRNKHKKETSKDPHPMIPYLQYVLSDVYCLFPAWYNFRDQLCYDQKRSTELSASGDSSLSQASNSTSRCRWRQVVLRQVILSHSPRWTDENSCRLYFMVFNSDYTEILYSSLVQGVQETQYNTDREIAFDVNCCITGDVHIRFYHLPLASSGQTLFKYRCHSGAIQASAPWSRDIHADSERDHVAKEFVILPVRIQDLDMSSSNTLPKDKQVFPDFFTVFLVFSSATDEFDTKSNHYMATQNKNSTAELMEMSSSISHPANGEVKPDGNSAWVASSRPLDATSSKVLEFPVTFLDHREKSGIPKSRIAQPIKLSKETKIVVWVRCPNPNCLFVGEEGTFVVPTSSEESWHCPKCDAKVSSCEILPLFWSRESNLEKVATDDKREEHAEEIAAQAKLISELCPHLPIQDIEDQVTIAAQKCKNKHQLENAIVSLLEDVLFAENARHRALQVAKENSPDYFVNTNQEPSSEESASASPSLFPLNVGDVVTTPFGLGVVRVGTLTGIDITEIQLDWGKIFLQALKASVVVPAHARAPRVEHEPAQSATTRADAPQLLNPMNDRITSLAGSSVSSPIQLHSSRRSLRSRRRISRSLRGTFRNAISGLSTREICRLPLYRFNALSRNLDSNCAICQYEYQGEDKIRVLPCFHSYHAYCVDEWLSRRGICPICLVSVRSGARMEDQ